MDNIIIKSSLLPKSKICNSGSPTAAINDIIASLTAIAPAGIEVKREIKVSKHTTYDRATNHNIESDLISRVTEVVFIKANLSSHTQYSAWTAARVDAFAKGGVESDSALSGGLTSDKDTYAAFGAGQYIVSFTINYQPTTNARSGEGYEHRVHAEMAPLAALAEARALWADCDVGISNSKFRRSGYGSRREPLNCSTVVKNALTELDSLIYRLNTRAHYAAKRAAELSPDLLAEEAARTERNRIRTERRNAALAKANAGDKYDYWPTMKFDSTELRIRDAHLSTSDYEAIAEIIVAAKARHAAKIAQKAA